MTVGILVCLPRLSIGKLFHPLKKGASFLFSLFRASYWVTVGVGQALAQRARVL